MKKGLLIAVPLTLSLPLSTLAHAGEHSTTGFLHLFTEPFHIASIVGVVALGAYFLVRRKKERVQKKQFNNIEH